MPAIPNQNVEVDSKTKLFKYGPRKDVRIDKDLFIAEYNSLRTEIVQRLSQQTILYQIAITAWGLMMGYALEKIDEKWFNDVILICVYPMLAFLISSGWAFNQTRISQIAQYLRARELDITEKFGLIWWENYVRNEPAVSETDKQDSTKTLNKDGKIKPAIMIIIGTQIASIVVATILVLIHIGDNIDPTLTESTKSFYIKHGQDFLLFAMLIIATDIFITYQSFKILRKSLGR